MLSGLLALLVLVLILWAIVNRSLGTWTLILLALPMLVFARIAWFVLRYGKEYIAGIRVYPEGLRLFFPLKKGAGQVGEICRFCDIHLLEFEETVEIHRAGRKLKNFNVYRIRLIKDADENLSVFLEMVDLLPDQVLKFRQLPEFIRSLGLLEEQRIDTRKMPKV
jgi:hypothetical protein